MNNLEFRYQKINKKGPSLTIPIIREQIIDKKSLIENEKFVIEQFPESYNPLACYILITIGEDEKSFLNTVMAKGVIETQLGHLDSKFPIFSPNKLMTTN